MRGPLLALVDLTEAEIEEVSSRVFSAIKMRPEDSYGAYVEVLSGWGIMCPHPTHMRIYPDGSRSDYFPKTTYRWYVCDCCKCRVISGDYDPRGGTSDG